MTPRSPVSLRRRPIAPLVLFAAVLGGCAANPWEPAAPRGDTWEYDYQGFRSSDTTVMAGTSPGFAYGSAFSFRDAREVHPEKGGKDPFAESAPLDGLHFNAHLERQGARLLPAGAASADDGVSREGGAR